MRRVLEAEALENSAGQVPVTTLAYRRAFTNTSYEPFWSPAEEGRLSMATGRLPPPGPPYPHNLRRFLSRRRPRLGELSFGNALIYALLRMLVITLFFAPVFPAGFTSWLGYRFLIKEETKDHDRPSSPAWLTI